ncbi:hypothetical protein ACFWAY_41310 [Rhodococcus sp. NPDC059968]|uniref:hypothetical protein n=1 Tax=Rhodococcus sp. NPDC059968 TaxID=3347017 RepID=UPI003670B59F
MGDLAFLSAEATAWAGAIHALRATRAANWKTIVMEHTDRDGTPRIVGSCHASAPIAWQVDRIITELAVFDVVEHELILRELAPRVPLKYLLDVTGRPVNIDKMVGQSASDPLRAD